MSKTIKIIDLLNKIANGEEVPKKIEFEENIFEYDSSEKEYKWWQDEERFIGQTLLFAVMQGHRINEILNCEVEIIEEQEEIDIQELEEIKEMEVFLSVDTRQTLEENLKKIDKHEVNFFFKINEIIRKQNKIVQYLEQLDKNIKEK